MEAHIIIAVQFWERTNGKNNSSKSVIIFDGLQDSFVLQYENRDESKNENTFDSLLYFYGKAEGFLSV